MKRTKYFLLLAAAFITSVAMAQQTTAKSAASSAKPGRDTAYVINDPIGQLSELVYKGVKDQSAKGVGVISADDTKKLIEYFNSNAEIRSKKDKLYSGNYSKPIVFERQSDESDRINWLKGIPVPKYPEAALQGDPRENERYTEKVKEHIKQVEEEARQLANTTNLVKTYQQGGTDAVKKKYEKEADKNEMIAQMGGAEKLQNMSDKEREEAAKKMVSNMTGGMTPEQIQNMSPEEKQELAKKMVAERMQQQMSSGQKPKVDQEAIQEAKDIQLIHDFQAKLYEETQKEMAPVNKLGERYEQQIKENMEKLAQWASAAIYALPVVRDSEYGPRRDGIEFVIFTQEYMAYMLGKDKIAKQREIWEKQVRVHVNAFKKMDDFVATYSKKQGLSDRMKMAVAGLMAAGYESAIDLNKSADRITSEAGSVQYSYNCNALRNCKDPRQDKY